MLRRFGRWPSPHKSDASDEKSADGDDNDMHRRSSEPIGVFFSSSLTPSPRGRAAHHSSIPEIGLSSRPHQQIRRKLEVPPRIDSLGLSIVYTCEDPVTDIIFVHGLGGSSTRTWCWDRDPQNFWPPWLGEEADIDRSRIFTFGYNANFVGEDTPSNILDFSKDLLFRMKTYSNAQSVNNRSIGELPIIFVMHSMGGLVVKKAYIIGRSDMQYARMMSQVRAMLFLATPHRGSAYAEFLHNVLKSAPGFSSKAYIQELEKASTTLQDINEQFRTICDGIQLVSLYETLKTSILTVKKWVVDKESAVLGYATESSSGLCADHHGICKFSSSADQNYVIVRDTLHMFVRDLISPAVPANSSPKQVNLTPVNNKRRLEELLGIFDDPSDDYEILRDRITAGSCEWLLRRPGYLEWKDGQDAGARILWLTGLPAVGKSVLSSFVVNSLEKNPAIKTCLYYFFKSEHQTKRTVGQMLRSIAFQAAMASQQVGEKLLKLCDSRCLPFGRQKVNAIWESIFEGIIFRQRFHQPLFWIIDGLDEADHPDDLVKLLLKLHSGTNIRLLIVSRFMRELTTLTIDFREKIQFVHEEIGVCDTFSDIRNYTNKILSATLLSNKAQEEICAKVLEKAHGSFLWVTLALDQLKDNWHLQNDVSQALNDLPEGMEPMYLRMIQIICNQAPRPRTIASKILMWTVCAFRPLELAELEVALAAELGDFVNLRNTIIQICGNFVIVNKSRVSLIHDTARHFLLHKTAGSALTIDFRLGNELVASTCLKYLMDPKKKWKNAFALSQTKHPISAAECTETHVAFFESYPFLSYAVRLWAYHVSLARTQTDLIFLVLEFLENSCLVWINAIGLLGDMRILTRAAQYLKLYAKRWNRKTSNDSLKSLLGSRDDELKQWAKDLIRVVGKFGNILTQKPQSVYKNVIPFCPSASIISRTYKRADGLSVMGISSQVWDDCLARLTMGNEEFAFQILCQGMYFVTLVESGVLIVWHAESCEEARRMDHGECISVMECGRFSPLIATAGMKTIRVWDITTGEELFRIPNLYERRILALSFHSAETELLVGYDDCSIQCVDLSSAEEKWKVLLEEPGDSDHLCAHLISFSPDNYHILVGYRGRPMLAWTLGPPSRGPQLCMRPEDKFCGHHDSWKAGTPERVVWRPGFPSVLIIYNDNAVFEWNIEDDEQREIADIRGLEMAISDDGNLLLTSDNSGTLSVWTVPEFRLVYQIQGNDIVRSLTFSPDGQRIYDSRGSYCNVWEPDALLRPDDLDREELSSTQDTAFSEPVSMTDEAGRAQITALVCDAEDRFYCCGKDNGAVVLHDIRTGERVRKVYGHFKFASVIEMAWSVTSTYIASADDRGRVIAKRLRKPAGKVTAWAVYPLLDFRPGEAVSQLLFSSSEEYVLVSSPTCEWIWSLKTKTEICRSVHPPRTGTKWMNHPLLADRLICINSEEVKTFSWSTLREVRRTILHDFGKSTDEGIAGPIEMIPPNLRDLSLQSSSSEENKLSIERAIPIRSTQIVFELLPTSGPKETYILRRRIALLDVTALQPGNLQPETVKSLSGQANRLIGSFYGHVVFLDHQYCVSTIDLRKEGSFIQRHFFLPKPWVSPGMLKLCIMNSQGTILCPKNGEVAIIRSGIKR